MRLAKLDSVRIIRPQIIYSLSKALLISPNLGKTICIVALYCCFIDFKQAFDTVWRDQLWQKLAKHHINGKCLTLLQNMYKNIKSNVTVNNNSSAFFPCQTGVRQGETLSPFLFSIFLNDLEMFLLCRNVQGITCDINYDEISVYIKLLVLLFADDTVLFGSSQSELQHAVNQFEKYCEEMQLTVNTTKTKVIIFTNKRNIQQSTFTFQSKALDVVTDYKYLGIYFAKNGSLTLAKKQVTEQANKALFSLLKRIKDLDLPYDLQIDKQNNKTNFALRQSGDTVIAI